VRGPVGLMEEIGVRRERGRRLGAIAARGLGLRATLSVIMLATIAQAVCAQLEDLTTASASLVLYVERAVALRIVDIEPVHVTMSPFDVGDEGLLLGRIHLLTWGLCDYVVGISARMAPVALPTGLFSARVSGASGVDFPSPTPPRVDLAEGPVPLLANRADWPSGTASTVEIRLDPSRWSLPTGTYALEIVLSIMEED
jgi:hypothetical protein